MSAKFNVAFTDLRWLESEPGTDYCSHGKLLLQIDGKHIQPPDGEPLEICATTAALRLLCSAVNGRRVERHPGFFDNQILPHCGHSWIPSGTRAVILSSCPIGIDWFVDIEDDSIHLTELQVSWTTGSPQRIEVSTRMPWSLYADPIIRAARTVAGFHQRSAPRNIECPEELTAINLFWKEYEDLLQSCEKRLQEVC